MTTKNPLPTIKNPNPTQHTGSPADPPPSKATARTSTRQRIKIPTTRTSTQQRTRRPTTLMLATPPLHRPLPRGAPFTSGKVYVANDVERKICSDLINDY